MSNSNLIVWSLLNTTATSIKAHSSPRKLCLVIQTASAVFPPRLYTEQPTAEGFKIWELDTITEKPSEILAERKTVEHSVHGSSV